MSLTTQQLQTLKAAIAAETDPTFVANRNNGDTGAMAAWYNEPTATIVWRTSVSRAEIQDDDAFNWAQVDNLSTGSKYRIWEWMFDNDTRAINPSKANIRAGIAATWVGNAQLLAVQNAVLARCKRAASRAETLYDSGTGTTADPGLLGWEGPLQPFDIVAALGS